jgi:hypothetical protein
VQAPSQVLELEQVRGLLEQGLEQVRGLLEQGLEQVRGLLEQGLEQVRSLELGQEMVPLQVLEQEPEP